MPADAAAAAVAGVESAAATEDAAAADDDAAAAAPAAPSFAAPRIPAAWRDAAEATRAGAELFVSRAAEEAAVAAGAELFGACIAARPKSAGARMATGGISGESLRQRRRPFNCVSCVGDSSGCGCSRMLLSLLSRARS